MTRPVRAATIGCGRMGAFHSSTVANHAPGFWMPISHLGALAALSETTPTACCDINSDAVEKACALHGVEQGYTDYHELLDRAEPDLLTIATRTPEKRPILEAAIDRGIRAFHVEKPLVNSLQDLQALAARITEVEARLTYGAIRRWLPPYLAAASMLGKSGLEDPLHIGIEMGRSPLLWTLVHGIDMILFYAGAAEPVAVQAWFETVELSPGAAHHVTNDPRLLSATIHFDNGTVGHIGAAMGDGVTISGPGARVEVLADGHQAFHVQTQPGDVYAMRQEMQIPRHPGPGGTAAALSALVAAHHGPGPERDAVAKTTRDILLGQRIVFGFLASHLDGGARLSLDDIPPDIRVDGMSYGAPA